MTRIGQEITFGEMQPAQLPPARTNQSAHVLDLRPQTTTNSKQNLPKRTSIKTMAITSAPTKTRLRSTKASPKWHFLQGHNFRSRTFLVRAAKAIIVLVAAIGLLLLNIPLAERFIGIYFASTVVFALDSQRTFLVALIFLVMVAVWSAFGNSVSAENFAIYAFYFLLIGLVSAAREILTGKNQPQEQRQTS